MTANHDSNVIGPLQALCKTRTGFTLIEMLIGMSILSFGLLGLAELHFIAAKGNNESRNLTSAVMLAETKVEELLNTKVATLSNGTFYDTNNPVSETGARGGMFTRSWIIADYEGSTCMKKITTTITWPGLKGNRSVSFNTLVSDVVDKAY